MWKRPCGEVHSPLCFLKQASQVAPVVKNVPANARYTAGSLGREDPLEEGVATHSHAVAWRIPGSQEPEGYSPQGHKDLDKTEVTYQE